MFVFVYDIYIKAIFKVYSHPYVTTECCMKFHFQGLDKNV